MYEYPGRGRPKGSQNKVSAEVKQRLADYLATNFDTFEEDLEKLSGKPEVRAKLYLEVVKLIVPKTKDTDEAEQEKYPKELLEKLFPGHED